MAKVFKLLMTMGLKTVHLVISHHSASFFHSVRTCKFLQIATTASTQASFQHRLLMFSSAISVLHCEGTKIIRRACIKTISRWCIAFCNPQKKIQMSFLYQQATTITWCIYKQSTGFYNPQINYLCSQLSFISKEQLLLAAYISLKVLT